MQRIAQNRPEVNAKRSASLKITASQPEVKARFSASSKESQNRPEVKKKHVDRMLHFWADPANKKQRLHVVSKNSRNKQTVPEKQLYELLQGLFPDQWKYTGDAGDKDFIIAGKIPDFIMLVVKRKLLRCLVIIGMEKSLLGEQKEKRNNKE